MTTKEKKSKKKIIINAIKKTAKLRYVVIIIILLLSNTYAWFIYSQTVQSEISAKVKAWKIMFKKDDDAVDSVVGINVDSIYPGMVGYQQQVTAYNESDVEATLYFRILEAKIMGDRYITQEGIEYYNLNETSTLTSDALFQKLAEDYPFKISVSIDPVTMDAHGGTSTVTISVDWEYESGDDELDTYWGMRAYDYSMSGTDESSIVLKVMLTVDQNMVGNESE